jgi:apolipoprotein N-acyltransferase
MKTSHKWALVISSGLCFFLSFPPFPLGFLAPLALSLMIPLMLLPSRKQAFWYPFFSGLLFNLGLLYWIPYLMEKGLYVVLILGMFLLLMYMAFWVGLTGLLVNAAASRGRLFALAAFPLIWTAQEKLRELGQMSFPWVMAGYTYGGYTRLIQALSAFGVYFYTFLAALTASLLFLVFRFRENRRHALAALGVLFMVYAALAFYGDRRLAGSETGGETLNIALIQANVDPNIKWSPGHADSIFTLHCRMTEAAAKNDSLDLAVWAESALPFYFLKRWGCRQAVMALSDSLRLPLVFGSIDFDDGPLKSLRPIRYYNSVLFYDPGKKGFLKYDKIRLVPFGEQLPFEGWFPIISRVDLGEADFSPGDSLHLFDLKGCKIFTPICYEVVYPEQMRCFVRAGGRFMVQVTNDAWYRRSGMTFQHTNICRFRAVEEGIPVARCANTGVSCFIDPYGRLDRVTPIFKTLISKGRVSSRWLDTFYSRHGDIAGWVCLYLTLAYFIILLLLSFIRKRHGPAR